MDSPVEEIGPVSAEDDREFDRLFALAWDSAQDSAAEHRSYVEEEYQRAVPGTGPGYVVVAFDGDEAGQKASDELMIKLMSDSPTYTNYIRSILIHGNPVSQSIKLLANRELANEISFWDSMAKVRGVPDWWHEMCQEHREVCLGEITRRSRKLNDLGDGALEYMKKFQEENTITDVLSWYGIFALPGKMARCPMHDDDTPSLSISPQDTVAYCWNQSCILWGDGHGVSSFRLDKIMSK